MPSESKYPSIQIPDVDLWGFLFERKEKPFADDKGRPLHNFAHSLVRTEDRNILQVEA
jgi:hypothetical protein